MENGCGRGDLAVNVKDELKKINKRLSEIESKIKRMGVENYKSPAFKLLIAEESELIKKKYRLEKKLTDNP